jgi:ATP-dependent DNA helicase RecG
MDLIEILKNPESKTLEFKQDLSSHLGFIRTLIAFANTAGGIVIIGIEDRTRYVVGIEDPLSLEEKITNLISELIAPQILPEIEILSYKNKLLIGVQVYPSSLRPHFLKRSGVEQGTYIRVGSTNRLADASLIQELKRFVLNQSFDEQPLIQENLESIDFEAVVKQFIKIRSITQKDLETLRLVVTHQGNHVPTVGGMLLFGKNRYQYFPDAWIQAGRFLGTNKSQITDTVTIRSHLALAVEEAIHFVRKHATLALEIKDAQRIERWSIPFQAVREAIVNAVVHADYSQIGSPIRISIFQDRLEIENPGLLPFGLTVEEISKGVSKLRNRVIGRVLNELKLVEQWGSGIQRIITECKENGLQPPKFEEIGTHFKVTLYLFPQSEAVLDKKDQEIISILKEQDSLSTNTIAQKIHLSSRAARTRLASLVQRSLLTELSSSQKDPTKRYTLSKNLVSVIY